MVPAARMTTSASSAQKTVDSGTVAAGSVAAVLGSSDGMVEGNRRNNLRGRTKAYIVTWR